MNKCGKNGEVSESSKVVLINICAHALLRIESIFFLILSFITSIEME